MAVPVFGAALEAYEAGLADFSDWVIALSFALLAAPEFDAESIIIFKFFLWLLQNYSIIIIKNELGLNYNLMN